MLFEVIALELRR